MNIRERLTAEHSKTLTTAIVNYIGDDKKRFKELMAIFLAGDYRLTQRAAWPMSFTAMLHPKLITPYFEKLVNLLRNTGNHPAINRNILRMFQEINIPEKYQGSLIDICFGFIIDATCPSAIRAFALTTAAKICAPHAELKNELLLIINDLMQFAQPPAIKSRIKSALKILKQAGSTV